MRPVRLGILWVIRSAIAALLFGQLVGAQAALADTRVALVIGNGAYKFAPALPAAPGDAAAMAKLLRSAGFDVVEGTDLSRRDMRQISREFRSRLQCADLAVLFFAGHGVAVDGVNYLLAVDADIRSEADARAINLGNWLGTRRATVNLAFLDAGRDERFVSILKSISPRNAVQSGLVDIAPDDNDWLIALSTEPGQPEPDRTGAAIGPFTRALIDRIARPGVDVAQAMAEVRTQVAGATHDAQTPSYRNTLLQKVYLNPVRDRDAVLADLEGRFWDWIKDLEDVEKLEAYLKLFPHGQFRGFVQSRIAGLYKPRPPVVRWNSPDVTNVPRSLGPRVCELQRHLDTLGYPTGMSGRDDAQTRSAITGWQAARGYPANGNIDDRQLKALALEGAAAEGGLFSTKLFRAPAER